MKQIVIMGLALLAAGAIAAPLSLDNVLQLPVGVRLRPPRGCQPVALPAPRAFLYQNSAGDRIEAVMPLDQWRFLQHAATLKSDEATIELARVKHLAPENLDWIGQGQKHVVRSDFTEAVQASAAPADEAGYRKWVEAWTGRSVSDSATSVHGFLLRDRYIRYLFAETAPNADQVWLLNHKQGPLMIRIQLPNLAAMDADRTVLAILRSVSETRATIAEPAAGKEPTSEIAKAKQQVVAGIQNVPGWWTAETDNYVIASNLDRRNRALVETIRRDVELIRGGYASLFPPVKPITAVSVIRVFAETDQYAAYVGKDLGWTSGIWDPSRKELVIAGDSAVSSRELRESVLNTAWHEAFHQYLFYALDHREPPIWLNEGFACLFESCEIDTVRKRMRLRDNEGRRRQLQDAIKHRPQHVDLARMLTMTRSQFYLEGHRGDAADLQRADYYAAAWGLAWFLTKAAPQYDNPGYKRIVPDTMMVLRETRNTQKAAAAGAKIADVPQLQRDFVDFWQDDRKQSRAERNQILPRL